MAHATGRAWLENTTHLFELVKVSHQEGQPRLDARSFLAACGAVSPVYDIIFTPGFVSRLLSDDLALHISSVANLAARFPKLHSLEDLIEQEVLVDGREAVRYNRHSGTFGALWLMRSISFNVAFVGALVDGQRRPARACAGDAYDVSLRPCHGFLVRGVVSMALGLCPSREHMLTAFGFSNEDAAEPVMRAYTAAVRRSLSAIDALLTRADLHFPDKA